MWTLISSAEKIDSLITFKDQKGEGREVVDGYGQGGKV